MSGAIMALSIRQPWAWLICNAGKDIENRDWRTSFRGRFLVHAGKTMSKADYTACTLFIATMSRGWRLPAYDILKQECGGIVGEASITACLVKSDSPWFCGPYGFKLADAKPLPFQPCNGALGFFRVYTHCLRCGEAIKEVAMQTATLCGLCADDERNGR